MLETVRNWCTKRLVLVVWSDSPCLNMDNPLVAEAADHVKNHLVQTHGQKGISLPTSCLPSPLLKKRAAFHQAPINGDQITFWSFLTVKVAKMSLYFLVPGLDPTDLAQKCVAHTSTRTGTLRWDICSDCANPIQKKEQDTKWMAEQYTCGLIATAPLQALLWLVVRLRTIAKKRIHKADVVYSNWPTFISNWCSMARSWVYHIICTKRRRRVNLKWNFVSIRQGVPRWGSERCAFKYVQTRLCGQADL